MGDTGLRLKPKNLGLGYLGSDNTQNPQGGANCTAPQVYGINQCYTNFTQDDLVQPQTGDYQGLDVNGTSKKCAIVPLKRTLM